MSENIIEAEVLRNEKIIVQCSYRGDDINLKSVADCLEFYVISEQLNLAGECKIRARKVINPS